MKKILMLTVGFLCLFVFAFADVPENYDGPSLDEIKEMDMDSECGLTLEQLEKGLMYDLVPLASTYLQVEEELEVNAVFKAAQDALESNWGQDCFDENNISGFFTHRDFICKEECIWFVSERLHSWYLTDPEDHCDDEYCGVGQFFNGYSIYDVSVKYCPADDGGINYDYGDAVCQIAYDIYVRALTEE